MCGVFAYNGPEPVDLRWIQQVAKLAGYRGPYSFGFAWRGLDESWQVYKQVGALDENLDTLERVVGAVQVIGHARLATSGDFRQLENNQPLIKDDVAIAHNGNVYNWQALARMYGFTPETANDSEALLHLIDGDVSASKVEQTIAQIDACSPNSLLVAGTDCIIAYRDRHPLYVKWADDGIGVYLCSRQIDGGRLLPAGQAIGFARTS
ncbi:hypothetical protein ACFLYO_00400 [Chloroflexota bacterium]